MSSNAEQRSPAALNEWNSTPYSCKYSRVEKVQSTILTGELLFRGLLDIMTKNDMTNDD